MFVATSLEMPNDFARVPGWDRLEMEVPFVAMNKGV